LEISYLGAVFEVQVCAVSKNVCGFKVQREILKKANETTLCTLKPHNIHAAQKGDRCKGQNLPVVIYLSINRAVVRIVRGQCISTAARLQRSKNRTWAMAAGRLLFSVGAARTLARRD